MLERDNVSYNFYLTVTTKKTYIFRTKGKDLQYDRINSIQPYINSPSEIPSHQFQRQHISLNAIPKHKRPPPLYVAGTSPSFSNLSDSISTAYNQSEHWYIDSCCLLFDRYCVPIELIILSQARCEYSS